MRIPLFKKKPERVPRAQLNVSLLAPPKDPIMSKYLEEVYCGERGLYRAIVPVNQIRLLHPHHRPDVTEPGKSILARIVEEIRMACVQNGLTSMPMPFLYVEGDEYISSDDYFSIFAYRQLGLSRVPCFVLGRPTVEGTTDVDGPAPLEAAKRLVTASG